MRGVGGVGGCRYSAGCEVKFSCCFDDVFLLPRSISILEQGVSGRRYYAGPTAAASCAVSPGGVSHRAHLKICRQKMASREWMASRPPPNPLSLPPQSPCYLYFLGDLSTCLNSFCNRERSFGLWGRYLVKVTYTHYFL